MDVRDLGTANQPGSTGWRIGLAVVIVAWGIQAIVTQSLLLREALVLMFGSELAWGIVLFAWLAGVAIGATVGGSVARRLRRADLGLVAVLLSLSILACSELWIFRGARAWLGVGPGAVLPLAKTALAALLLVGPAGALVGAAFPLACRMMERADLAALDRDDKQQRKPRGAGVLGHVYALEAAGSLIGGAAFSFWAVEHLRPIETALLCGVLTLTASGGFLIVASRRPFAGAALLALAVAAGLASLLGGQRLSERLVERRWIGVAPGYELCAHMETKYQHLAVGRRAEQYTLYSDGQVSVDFPDPYTFVPLAHFWMCQHPSPKHVLMLGGGAEGLLAELLRHPITHVDYVEPDPKLLELIEPYLPDGDRRALADNQVSVHNVDARYFVKTQRDRYDLIIARLPEPTSALRARFYTEDFFRELRRAMKPQAVLCMTANAAPANLTAPAAEYLASIQAALRPHFPHITVGWGNPAHVLAATEAGLVTIDPATLTARYAKRGVESDLFDPLWFEGATDWLDPRKVGRRSEEIEAVRDAPISTDLRPVVYMQRLALWERMTSGPRAGVVAWLRSVRLHDLVVTLGALAGATLIGCRMRYGPTRRASASGRTSWLTSGAIILAVATTGFATMALSIIWLFAFQNLYGYVYQRIGWIIALFMAGLVIGCGVVARRLSRVDTEPRASARAKSTRAKALRSLIAADLLLALLALTVPFLLPALGEIQSTQLALALVEWTISIMVALTGAIGGATFALAGALMLGSTRSAGAGATAGVVIGADHAGACLGALLTGIILVPVFGTPAAALVLVGMKLASAALLTVARRLHFANTAAAE